MLQRPAHPARRLNSHSFHCPETHDSGGDVGSVAVGGGLQAKQLLSRAQRTMTPTWTPEARMSLLPPSWSLGAELPRTRQARGSECLGLSQEGLARSRSGAPWDPKPPHCPQSLLELVETVDVRMPRSRSRLSAATGGRGLLLPILAGLSLHRRASCP